ncbi:hypothetical protein [Methanobacterium spitsbergense]|uniref:Uncharacterized protein n=1 Tax=Methanobacterium spitsbergense TaxID=2874285 RepID=A0A8T5V4X0_9EURY|nr:hypothetical protein [Methanobacterium spitsbergense]MBZ2166715.1 hypothetical protein [Methanobacterium spitsbergense]
MAATSVDGTIPSAAVTISDVRDNQISGEDGSVLQFDPDEVRETYGSNRIKQLKTIQNK